MLTTFQNQESVYASLLPTTELPRSCPPPCILQVILLTSGRFIFTSQATPPLPLSSGAAVPLHGALHALFLPHRLAFAIQLKLWEGEAGTGFI